MLFVTALLVTAVLHLFILGAPFVPTPRSVAQRMVRLARLRGSEMVYDLGAGDGAILIEAARAHPGIRAIGIEFVPTVWLWGKIRIWLFGQKVDLRLGDAFRRSVRDADVVFLYLTSSMMKRMTEKFERELRPGTVIISHAFTLPGREPVEVSEVPRRLGGATKVRRYEW